MSVVGNATDAQLAEVARIAVEAAKAVVIAAAPAVAGELVELIAARHGRQFVIDHVAAARMTADAIEDARFGPEPTTNRGGKTP